jgi:hypothetical protein
MAASAELVQEIARQARAAGMNPLDLLTVIGYETAGTYNPAQPGPRTKWGQHRGLIQFGEPQARQYGVDFSGKSPVGNQVAAAIQFIKDHGWRPGMGRLEMYAAINAGDATKIHASDAKAGGAPGSVLDKVRGQMGAHEARAKNLLSQYDTGGEVPPGSSYQGIPGGVDPETIPWGGYGYTPPNPAPGGLVAPQGGQTPDVTTTGSTGKPTGLLAPTAPYSVAPNSDAARMLSDPTRYGLSPAQSVEMRRQLEAGGPGGGVIGNVPAPQPDQPQTAGTPPSGLLANPTIPPQPSFAMPAPGEQGTVAGLFDDFKKRMPPGLMMQGWA